MVLGLLALTVALSGCARLGTVLTGFELSSEVEVSANAPVSRGETFLAPNPLRSRKRFPYDFPAYRDEAVEWSLYASRHGFVRMDVRIPLPNDLTLRWDLANVRSSENSEYKPLLVSRFSSGTPTSRLSHIDDPTGTAQHRPPALTLPAAEGRALTRIDFMVDPGALFPNAPDADLFGVRPHREGFGFIDEGIGRWIELELPVEAGEHVWRYRVRLTLERAHQWVSYF